VNTLDIEAWNKPADGGNSIPMGIIHFRVNEEAHVRLEQAEQALIDGDDTERMLDIDMTTMELETPAECGTLADCQLRIYVKPGEERGHFHLVGHKASDGTLVYSNAVMVDQLG